MRAVPFQLISGMTLGALKTSSLSGLREAVDAPKITTALEVDQRIVGVLVAF